MTTYAQQQSGKSFDWNAALASPPEVGSDEHGKLIRLATSWVTCACGNQCATIPRSPGMGAPLDLRLWDLGNRFGVRVQEGNWPAAKDLLLQIEQRSTEILYDQAKS